MLLFELFKGDCRNGLQLFLLSLELIRMLDNFFPESSSFSCQIFILLTLGALQSIFKFLEGLLVKFVKLFLEDFIDKSGDILLELICVLDIALNQDRQSNDTSMVIRKAHHNIAKLFLGSEEIKCGLLDKGVS